MKTETEIKECDYCKGRGYTTRECESSDSYYIDHFGCSSCGGKGENRSGLSEGKRINTLVKGSGKVKVTYKPFVRRAGEDASYARSRMNYQDKNGEWWTYDSSEPVKDGCFLTTAACIYKGLPDDCKELMVLRQFRDEYLVKTDWGMSLIEEYYESAPKIAAQMSTAELENMYKIIVQCVDLIETDDFSTALALYKHEFYALCEKYVTR